MDPWVSNLEWQMIIKEGTMSPQEYPFRQGRVIGAIFELIHIVIILTSKDIYCIYRG